MGALGVLKEAKGSSYQLQDGSGEIGDRGEAVYPFHGHQLLRHDLPVWAPFSARFFCSARNDGSVR